MNKRKLRHLTEIWIRVWTGFASNDLVKHEGGRNFICAAKHTCDLFYGCFSHLVERHLASADQYMSWGSVQNYFALYIQERPRCPEVPAEIRAARTKRMIERHAELFRMLA